MPLSTAARTLAISALFAVSVAAQAQVLVRENFEGIPYGRVMQTVPGWNQSQFRFFVDYDPTGYTADRPIFSKYSLCYPEFVQPAWYWHNTSWAGKTISYDMRTATTGYLMVESWVYCPTGYTGDAAFGVGLQHPTAGYSIAQLGVDASTGRVWIRDYFGNRVYSSAITAEPGRWHLLSLQLDPVTRRYTTAVDGWDTNLSGLTGSVSSPITMAGMFVDTATSAPRFYFDDHNVTINKKFTVFRRTLVP